MRALLVFSMCYLLVHGIQSTWREWSKGVSNRSSLFTLKTRKSVWTKSLRSQGAIQHLPYSKLWDSDPSSFEHWAYNMHCCFYKKPANSTTCSFLLSALNRGKNLHWISFAKLKTLKHNQSRSTKGRDSSAIYIYVTFLLKHFHWNFANESPFPCIAGLSWKHVRGYCLRPIKNA